MERGPPQKTLEGTCSFKTTGKKDANKVKKKIEAYHVLQPRQYLDDVRRVHPFFQERRDDEERGRFGLQDGFDHVLRVWEDRGCYGIVIGRGGVHARVFEGSSGIKQCVIMPSAWNGGSDAAQIRISVGKLTCSNTDAEGEDE